MDRLWAPWRAQYIRDASMAGETESGCFLCRYAEASPSDDRENLVVWRRPHTIVVMNRFPYNNGHLLVAPVVHLGTLGDSRGPILTEPIETIRDTMVVLDQLLRPQGYNVGLNQGRSAGAGLPGHLHWHVVPRWDGDSNFMPVLGHAKVIIESLLEFHDRFIAELAGCFGNPPQSASPDLVREPVVPGAGAAGH
jgi:ATP adenylyltransferase